MAVTDGTLNNPTMAYHRPPMIELLHSPVAAPREGAATASARRLLNLLKNSHMSMLMRTTRPSRKTTEKSVDLPPFPSTLE
jgi:hypothetical protein